MILPEDFAVLIFSLSRTALTRDDAVKLLNPMTEAERAADSVEFARLPEPPAGMEVSKVDVVVRLRRR